MRFKGGSNQTRSEKGNQMLTLSEEIALSCPDGRFYLNLSVSRHDSASYRLSCSLGTVFVVVVVVVNVVVVVVLVVVVVGGSFV